MCVWIVLRCVPHFVIPWTHQAPLSMESTEFSRQDHWSGLPFPTPRDLPGPGIKLHLLRLLHLQVDSLLLCHLGFYVCVCVCVCVSELCTIYMNSYLASLCNYWRWWILWSPGQVDSLGTEEKWLLIPAQAWRSKEQGQWCSSSLKAIRLETQEELMFLCKFKDKKKVYVSNESV